MNPTARPIPLASVVVYPPWLPKFAFVTGALGGFGVLTLLVAIAAGWQAAPQGAQLAAVLVTLAATGLLLAFAWALPRARIRPQHLFRYVQPKSPRPSRAPGRRFRSATIVAAAALVVLLAFLALWAGPGLDLGPRAIATTIVNVVLVFATIGFAASVRRHQHRQAIALFALYAEGVLDPEATRTIDEARAADPAFAAAVCDYLRIHDQVVASQRTLA